MISNLYSWIDAQFDRIAERLAENMTDNADLYQQNKSSRQHQLETVLETVKAERDTVQQGQDKQGMPWHVVYSQIPVADLKRSLVFASDKPNYQATEKVLLLA